MPMMFESIDLEDVFEDEKFSMGWVAHSVENGRVIKGYAGDYTHTKYGSVELYSHIAKNGEQNELDGCNLQVSGAFVWKVYLGPLHLKRDTSCVVASVKGYKTGGFTIMNIINPEVLPSFMENDELEVQVVANAISVNYYENEDALAGTIDPIKESKNEEFIGLKCVPAMGSVLPNGFLCGHMVTEEQDMQEEYEYHIDDELVLITGIVKNVYIKKVIIEEEEFSKFLVTTIDTQFGDLEIVHSRSMISDQDIPFIKEGAVIQAVAVLSGDPAINEYEDGIIKTHKNDLSALRYALMEGNAERLNPILDEAAVFESVNIETPINGKNSIIERINYVNDNTSIKYYSYLATLHDEYEGERCIVLAENDEDNYTAIVRIEVDESGNITHIRLTNDSSMIFTIDSEPVFERDWEDDFI
ncbi:hypothetical protein [Eubacterium oxidoreducens]|uniref:Uncharacterized protein n=1 Tax=Eubacterium oxidoreducens TaxID=1732 RepID=A0A1G6AZC1_EUBOX|nr:hypothetical protein [Eubacterium oxidoreducens]SDB13629.1 hypothetical protein SAMN02910417_01046 [Eubacterium oxidoreducens]